MMIQDLADRYGVASPPIRPRILKVSGLSLNTSLHIRCIASDPTEDTERREASEGQGRYPQRCIASDPTEDTESGNQNFPFRTSSLSCIASDPTEDTESLCLDNDGALTV